MEDLTLALAILLAAGIFCAEIGKRLKLPSVTGYILAGLILGPTGLSLVSDEDIFYKLSHFTHIALMLISFGIGEQIEIKEIKGYLKGVGLIGFMETAATFLLVGLSTLFIITFLMDMPVGWSIKDSFCLSVLLGSVSVATAPAATLHVIRELQAKGGMTTTLMAVVAFDNGLAIMFFSVAMSLVNQIIGVNEGKMLMAVALSVLDIFLSLIMGVVTGIIIDYIIKFFEKKHEMLTAGLAMLLLAGESARLLNLSSLLVGMAAGFTLINRDVRDARLFKAFQDFGPPVYVLFFTLAGAHLDLSIVKTAGILGFSYYISRVIGKIVGAGAGARLADSADKLRRYLGMALLPQAGVAIGLIFLISGDPSLAKFALFITPVVLTGVVLSELTGPLATRYALERSGEVISYKKKMSCDSCADSFEEKTLGQNKKKDVIIAPWDRPPLIPFVDINGAVIVGAANPKMASGLARVAIILGHYYKSSINAVRVFPDIKTEPDSSELERYFEPEKSEGELMNVSVNTLPITGMSVEEGLLMAINSNDTRCVVLGYPVMGTIQGFQTVVEKVAVDASCPVIVVKFAGLFSTKRILVPVISLDQLEELKDVIEAFHTVRGSVITIMYLMPYDSSEEEVKPAREKLIEWARENSIVNLVKCIVVCSESRSMSIVEESEQHSLIVMASAKRSQIHTIFFGSLVKAVGQKSEKPLIIVNNP